MHRPAFHASRRSVHSPTIEPPSRPGTLRRVTVRSPRWAQSQKALILVVIARSAQLPRRPASALPGWWHGRPMSGATASTSRSSITAAGRLRPAGGLGRQDYQGASWRVGGRRLCLSDRLLRRRRPPDARRENAAGRSVFRPAVQLLSERQA